MKHMEELKDIKKKMWAHAFEIAKYNDSHE